MNPLEGYKVLDLTQNLCGPICMNILEDMGAEVIKFENLRLWPAGAMGQTGGL